MAEGAGLIEWKLVLHRCGRGILYLVENVYLQEVQEIEGLFIFIASFVRLEADQSSQMRRGSGDAF